MSTQPTSLKALAAQTEGISRTDSFRVDPNIIELEKGFNLREETEELKQHIDRLYHAMKAGASVPAVDVQIVDGVPKARDGHCRIRAAKRLRKEEPEFTLECRQLRGNDLDALFHMMGTGTGGKSLTPLEAGKGYLRAIKMGCKPAEIATRLGVSVVTISNGITLAEAPAEVQQMIASGEVSATTARDAIKQGSEGVAALKDAVKKNRAEPAKKKNGKKAKVTAKKLKGTKAEKKTKKAKKKDAPAAAPVAPVEPAPVDPGSVVVTISRETATAVFEFIRDFGGTDNAHLDAMKATLETALL